MKRFISITLAAGLAIGVLIAIVLGDRPGSPGEKTPTTLVRGVIGSEKQAFFADPAVRKAFERHGLRVEADPAGSRQIATSIDLGRYDFAFPSSYEPDGWIGVDLGIANIATTSSGHRAAGRRLNRHRRRQAELRRKLQAKRTKSAKRVLKRRRRKEARRAADINHCISKRIVTEAERTSYGIGLEDLSGIRERARLRKPQRVALHSWGFAQLGSFITYKARRAGVPVVFIDPRNTSRQCADCGHIDKKNRPSQAVFICRGCGVVAHADRNASRNIAHRAQVAWDAGRRSSAPGPSS